MKRYEPISISAELYTCLLLFVLDLGGCALFQSEPVRSALETLAPAAAELLAERVVDRWGADAEVDTASAGCFPAADEVADSFADDEREFEYVVCRAKASR